MRLTWDEFLWGKTSDENSSTLYLISQQYIFCSARWSQQLMESALHIYILYCLVKCVSDVQGLWSESIFEKRPCKALYSTAWGVVVWRESYSFGEVLSKVDENSWLNSSACVVCMCLCLSWPAPGRSAKEWAQIENTQAKKLTHWAPKKNETKRPNNHHHHRPP